MSDNKTKIPIDSIRDRMKSSPKSNAGIGDIWLKQRRTEKEELIERKRRKLVKKQKLKQQKDNQKKKIVKSKELVRVHSKRKFAVLVGIVIGVLSVVLVKVIVFDNNSVTGTLGESVDSSVSQEELPREKPVFSLLFPTGSNADEYDVVRISPPESEASYTYLDRFTEDGQVFRVTQQEIPDNFSLAKIATDFQATSIIRIDDNIVYHGYSEKGGVQSLLFIKDNKFIAIRSPQKFSDDAWVGYITSLK